MSRVSRAEVTLGAAPPTIVDVEPVSPDEVETPATPKGKPGKSSPDPDPEEL